MSKTIFRFKEFAIDQQGSAMKINTDGVLLAAMTKAVRPKTILDIGAGTGVIGLMLAQRFPVAHIEALEINLEAAKCAEANFIASPFSERLTLHAIDFQHFKPQQTYDLVVSNPPFFLNSLKNPNVDKAIARHAGALFFNELFALAYAWLSVEGSFQVILPLAVKEDVMAKGLLSPWHIQQEIHIRSFENSEVIRVILILSKQPNEYPAENFVIYKEKGIYSQEYRTLLQPFFLNF